MKYHLILVSLALLPLPSTVSAMHREEPVLKRRKIDVSEVYQRENFEILPTKLDYFPDQETPCGTETCYLMKNDGRSQFFPFDQNSPNHVAQFVTSSLDPKTERFLFVAVPGTNKKFHTLKDACFRSLLALCFDLMHQWEKQKVAFDFIDFFIDFRWAQTTKTPCDTAAAALAEYLTTSGSRYQSTLLCGYDVGCPVCLTVSQKLLAQQLDYLILVGSPRTTVVPKATSVITIRGPRDIAQVLKKIGQHPA